LADFQRHESYGNDRRHVAEMCRAACQPAISSEGTDMNFDPSERDVLARLADVLIPSAEGMPSASQAGVAGLGLDQILAARPDLAKGLKEVLTRAAQREPHEAIAQLQAGDSALFGVLAEVVPGAYFMNPDVRQAIGYVGQSPRPIDPHPDYMDDGLLDAVVKRGPIYRSPPSGNGSS
jgi:hypothetical protein